MGKIKNKIKEINTVEAVVHEVLEKNEKARGDDRLLYVEVCKIMCPSVLDKSFSDVWKNWKTYKLPNTETVRRTRQKAQEHDKSLRPNNAVQNGRNINQMIFKEYAKDNL